MNKESKGWKWFVSLFDSIHKESFEIGTRYTGYEIGPNKVLDHLWMLRRVPEQVFVRHRDNPDLNHELYQLVIDAKMFNADQEELAKRGITVQTMQVFQIWKATGAFGVVLIVYAPYEPLRKFRTHFETLPNASNESIMVWHPKFLNRLGYDGFCEFVDGFLPAP